MSTPAELRALDTVVVAEKASRPGARRYDDRVHAPLTLQVIPEYENHYDTEPSALNLFVDGHNDDGPCYAHLVITGPDIAKLRNLIGG